MGATGKTFTDHRRGRRALALVPLVVGWSLQASPSEPSFRFAVAAGPLSPALNAYAALTGMQIFYTEALVAGRRTSGVTGALTADVALTRLLAGTGLVARQVKPGVIVIEAGPGGAGKPDAVGDTTPGDPRLALADPAPAATAGAADATVPDGAIVVTGTHIRGRSPGAPPVTTIGRGDLVRNGYATAAQALQALPQNFGGVASEQPSLSFADGTGANNGLASGVNLRGLGAGATLVLLNGQRLGGSGLNGDFADVSSLPTGALDRIEVLTDGASAIYGSDAVAGVVNIMMRRKFDGVETRLRGATVTQGGKRDVQVDQTIGRDWGTGGFILSYEFDRSGRLASDDRRYARSADSRSLGGTDHRYYFSLPGNVLGLDPVTGGFGPLYAIPAGQDGTKLTPGDFQQGPVNLENFRARTDLIPKQTRHSAYASVIQQIAPGIEVGATALYSRRAFDARSLGGISVFSVTAANPYFVSPDGANSDLIAYSLGEELGPSRVHGFAEAMAYGGDMTADLGRSWKLRASANYAQQRERDTTDNQGNDASIAEALGTSPDDPTTPFSTAVDGFFNPYGTGNSNSRTILNFIGNGFTQSVTKSTVTSGHLDADGTLVTLPGGPLQIALGGDVRREHFTLASLNRFATVDPVPGSRISGGRTILAGFAELRIPLVDEAMGVPGVHRLAISAAGRVEHYSDFGTTGNPKVGLSWTPVNGIGLRGSYGTSFHAPDLTALHALSRIGTAPTQDASGATVPVIELSGGNPGLQPEQATSWTAGVDITPKALPGLTIQATWFRTAFRRRVGSPVAANFATVLTDPSLAPFVTRVSPATNPADLPQVNALLASGLLANGSLFPATSIGAIVDARYVNTGSLTVDGLDMTVGYSTAVGRDRLDLSANGSLLLDYRERTTPTARAVDRRNLAGQPVDFRGRLTAGWTHGAANALVGVNYVDRYRDLLGNQIKAWTTVDLQVGWTPEETIGWVRGFSVSLVAQNLLDHDPPFYDSSAGAGYDAANAGALGRLVSLQISKRW